MRAILKVNWDSNLPIYAISQSELQKKGIHSLLLDVDGTLVNRKSNMIPKDVKNWIKESKKNFSRYLISNNPSKKRIANIAKELNLSHTDILNFLKARNIKVSSHMSPVDEATHKEIMNEFAKDKEQVDRFRKEQVRKEIHDTKLRKQQESGKKLELLSLTKQRELEKKEIILKNEEILLTKEMYEEKRILLDEEWKEARGYQQKVFGFEGLYFLKKKELIQPIQDILFESIENVAKRY